MALRWRMLKCFCTFLCVCVCVCVCVSPSIYPSTLTYLSYLPIICLICLFIQPSHLSIYLTSVCLCTTSIYLSSRRRRDNRGWDGWMASPTQWTWVCASSGSWWWTGKPGVLQSMGLQRVGHDWGTELNWSIYLYLHLSKHLWRPELPHNNFGFPKANMLERPKKDIWESLLSSGCLCCPSSESNTEVTELSHEILPGESHLVEPRIIRDNPNVVILRH